MNQPIEARTNNRDAHCFAVIRAAVGERGQHGLRDAPVRVPGTTRTTLSSLQFRHPHTPLRTTSTSRGRSSFSGSPLGTGGGAGAATVAAEFRSASAWVVQQATAPELQHQGEVAIGWARTHRTEWTATGGVSGGRCRFITRGTEGGCVCVLARANCQTRWRLR